MANEKLSQEKFLFITKTLGTTVKSCDSNCFTKCVPAYEDLYSENYVLMQWEIPFFAK